MYTYSHSNYIHGINMRFHHIYSITNVLMNETVDEHTQLYKYIPPI